MAYRNQNKPPLNTNLSAATSLSTPPTRKAGGNEIRKQVVGRPTRDESASINASSDCGIEFSNEMVDDLLNEKVKVKNKFDYKGKCEQMSEYIKKLRLCINWFQQVEQNHLLDKEKLQILFNSSETKCQETEHRMQETLQHMETQILDLRRNNACLEEKLRKVEADKMAAIESLKSEQEARVSIEGMRASLAEEFERSQQELKRANKTIESLNEACRASQEYNTGLQGYNATLQKECETYKVNHKRLEQEKAAMFENHITVKHRYKLLQEELASFQASRDEALNQKDTLNTELCCLRSELQQARDDRDCQQMQAQNLTVELVNYKELTGKYSREMDNLIVKNKVLEETCSSHKEEIRILQNQLDVANEKLKVSDITTSDTRMEYEDQKRLVQNLQLRLADAEFQIVEAEKLRKKLHNTILELKGNIRVFCRVRPMLPDDGVGSEASVISYPVSTEFLGRGIDLLHSAGQKHQFSFDKVFAHDSSQNDVFVEISQLVQSALDGYKVCIFAYGQTGSGKTYTMMGKPETPEQKGLIPRSLEQIFQSSQGLVSQGWKYKMQASMLEIYNETIRDLLSTNRVGNLDNGPTGKQHTIKHDINGNACVSDLTVVDVCSLKQVSSLLNQAAQSRSVGKTQMNEQSSRSHFVFTLHIVGFNESTDQQVHGILNLIDLAGSERLSRSGVTGDRLRETQAINKSLSSLSDVIFSLAKKEEHVPFRNSKLTYLLQPCLGGDSKTLMFVNVSPNPSSMGESLCSLRFAAKVNACEIGVPRRQTTMRSSDSRLSYG